MAHWISFYAIGGIHSLWCCSSRYCWTTASCFSGTFVEFYNFAAVFLLSHDEVLYVGVIVLLATSKSKLLSQVFEVNIGQDFSVKITKLTF